MSSIVFSHRVPEARGPRSLAGPQVASHRSLAHVYSLMGPWATPSCCNSVFSCFAAASASWLSSLARLTTITSMMSILDLCAERRDPLRS